MLVLVLALEPGLVLALEPGLEQVLVLALELALESELAQGQVLVQVLEPVLVRHSR